MAELIWIYSIAGVQVAALADLLDLEIDERLQESETLSFTVRADDPKANYISEDRIVRHGARHYRVADIELSREGSRVVYKVTAEASWIDLLSTPATTTPIIGVTRAGGLDAILTGSGWTRGSVEADGGEFSMNVDQDATTLALVRAWATMTGRELVFDTAARTVSLAVAQGSDRGLGFRYGRNLITVKRKSQPPTATRLYAYGAENLSIDSVNPTGQLYIDNFDFYTSQGLTLAQAQAQYLKVQTWEDSRYLLALNLFDAATARLAALAQPRVSYELTVADLSAVTGISEAVGIGDTVRVDDAPTGIRISTRVVRRVTRPLDPKRNAVELGYLQPGLSTGTAGSSGGSGSTAPQMNMLVDLNASPLTIAGGQIDVNAISFGVQPGSVSNLIFGLNLELTATGSGTLTVAFFSAATPVGPTVQIPFTAGPVHVSVNDFLVGLTDAGSTLRAKAQVTSGTGTLTIAGNAAHMYILGSGLAGGGVSTSPTVAVAEAVTVTASGVADAGVTHALATPIGAPIAETVDTTPATTTDTVTAVTTP